MKPIKKTTPATRQTRQKASATKSRTGSIRLTVVSESERAIYRVPSYGYIL